MPDGEVTHGGVGLIVPVRRHVPGTAAVLKASFPHPGNVHVGRARTQTLAEAGAGDEDEIVAVAGRSCTPSRPRSTAAADSPTGTS